MRKSRFTEQQIRLAVEQAAAGVAVDELCRKYCIGATGEFRQKGISTQLGYLATVGFY